MNYCISRAIVPLFFENPEFALKKLKVLKAGGWDGGLPGKLLWKLWSEDSRESALVIRHGQQLFEVVKDWMDPSTLEFKFDMAPFILTTAGRPYSRATTAPCDNGLPISVINPEITL